MSMSSADLGTEQLTGPKLACMLVLPNPEVDAKKQYFTNEAEKMNKIINHIVFYSEMPVLCICALLFSVTVCIDASDVATHSTSAHSQ